MNMNLVDSVLPTARTGDKMADENAAATTTITATDENAMIDDDGDMQVRTMEVPRWLSTLEVTSKFCAL